MYLLEAADDNKRRGLPGRRVLPAPPASGFLRFSCAEPDERLVEAVHFLREAVTRTDRVTAYLAEHPKYRAE